ncbi:hypothetical protein BKA70DRAFT_1232071 [Coprinopsis sp. MPI-PUGE-AT-0042]|nr:hypothetical protein BKA70DRAFT_1232071 [Coprinopsis sp. MPI-PUGE-AT-0042]
MDRRVPLFFSYLSFFLLLPPSSGPRSYLITSSSRLDNDNDFAWVAIHPSSRQTPDKPTGVGSVAWVTDLRIRSPQIWGASCMLAFHPDGNNDWQFRLRRPLAKLR